MPEAARQVYAGAQRKFKARLLARRRERGRFKQRGSLKLCGHGGGRSGSLPGGAWKLRAHLVQQPVDEPTGIFGAELFSELYGFVDGDNGRNLTGVDDFEDGKAQDVTINSCDSRKAIIFCEPGDELINGGLMEANALYQRLGKSTGLWCYWPAGRERVEFVWIGSTGAQFPKIWIRHRQLKRHVNILLLSNFSRLKIPLKEKLNGGFTPLPTEA